MNTLQESVSTASYSQFSTVDARRQRDGNPNSSVFAETIKLLANISYGYQIIDRSRHIVKKHLNDRKIAAAINSKLFKQLNPEKNSINEVEFVKAEIEHKGPIIVWFFILQYAKLQILQQYYIFSTYFCHVNNFEELERDKDFLYLPLIEKELEKCMRPEMKAKWERLRSKDCTDSFTADAVANCSSKVLQHSQKTWQERAWTVPRNSDAQRYYVYVAILTAAMILPQTSRNSVIKVWTNFHLNRVVTALGKTSPRLRRK